MDFFIILVQKNRISAPDKNRNILFGALSAPHWNLHNLQLSQIRTINGHFHT